MTRNELNNLYFKWMCRLVCGDRKTKYPPHHLLLQHLHERQFIPSFPMDENRAYDGTDLRYRFGYEYCYDGPMIATFLDDRPCSMLEMMIGVSIHCEETFMDTPEVGNRTGYWFWNMVDNLGLTEMTDSIYNPEFVDRILDRFTARKYRKDGWGGLFYIPGTKQDLRNAEIWYQMCWYLDEFISKGG